MMASDPSICMLHSSKRQPVGVCHLCLRDRLMRLSLSGDSSSSHTLMPSCSSRSSFDSSCSKTDDSGGMNNMNGGGKSSASAGKLGTIFSLMESDSEEARIEEQECDEDVQEIPFRRLPRSRSNQPPRRSSSGAARDSSIFSRFAPSDGIFAKNISASATPVPDHLKQPLPPAAPHPQQIKNSGSGLSWISSLFRLRKRKKKSAHGGAVETNFFPPEAWNDDFPHPTSADRDRLWRSRSVSSGRVIKKSFTPLEQQEGEDLPGAAAGFEPMPGRFSVSAPGLEPPRVSSLIALDMRDATKVINNAAYDVAGERAYVAGAARSSVASLMDIDRRCGGGDVAASSSPPGVSFMQRSKSTGGWRRKIRSESPSSVLMPNPTAGGAASEWSFYLTPLRTFSRNRSSRHHAR